MSTPKSRVAPVWVSGPLASYADGFKESLGEKGYTALSRVNQLRLMGHLSNWLADERLTVSDLNAAHVEEFLLVRRAAGYTAWRTTEALAPLLDFLRVKGVLPEPAEAAAKSAVELVLASFGRYLLSERALATSTAAAYVARVDRFLAGCAADGDLSSVTAGDVTRAVLDESATQSVGSCWPSSVTAAGSRLGGPGSRSRCWSPGTAAGGRCVPGRGWCPGTHLSLIHISEPTRRTPI